MDILGNAFTWLHVAANLVWIGSILAVGTILTAKEPAPAVRGELALRVYQRLAVPAFVVSFACGASRLAMNTSYYLVEHHWMHPKLTVALVVIGLHHVIGARARKLARGTVQEAGPAGMLSALLAVMAVLAAFFAIFRLPG
jgi:protoporphyrinogen IX oxidase